ncbi:MAG: HAMP domain-containing protein [Candidatus Aureabacteria bacterium]|nr:HAMP domain-containing protein [Candidatus Auribacterota bacterium]
MSSNKKIRFGIKLKFVIAALSFISFIVITFTFFFLNTYRQVLETKLKEKGIALTKTLAQNSQSEYFLWLKNEEKLKGFLRGVVNEESKNKRNPQESIAETGDKDIIYGAFFDEEKKVVAKKATGDFFITSSKLTKLFEKEEIGSKIFKDNGKELMQIVIPVMYYENVSSSEDLILEGVMTAPESGKRKIIGYAVTVLSFKSIDDSLKNIKKGIAIYLSLFASISMITIFFWVGVVALNPINRLLLAIQLITKGNYNQRVSIRSNDELGDLAEAFNFMASVIEKSNRELEDYSRELENKVRQRTKEIEDMQIQLIQAGKLAAVGELSAGIAHELNNPIGGILGYSQFIVEKIKKNPEDVKNNITTIEKYLSLIARESQRCKRIIRNLLRFSRASKIEFEPTDINIVLKESIDIIASQFETKNIKFEYSFEKDLPLTQSNANQLQQVLTNILINAQKAIGDKKNGVIHISSSIRRGKEDEHNDFIEIRIKDNGYGISKENISKVFDPFFTTRKTGEGTGLGLSLSYGIIKDHGGDILLESKEGEGAAFTIILPVITG